MSQLQPSNATTVPRPNEGDIPTVPTAHAAPRAYGESRYRVVRLHAQGGLGEVHVAEDTELGRAVALKRIKSDRRTDPGSVRRFLREAEITARLEHPGIVPVHGLVRDADGQPAYAMRFVEGETLRQALDDYQRVPDRLGFRRLLGHFVAACKTVAYAHSRGVIHRDLKPANILLGQFGETLVVDWGLAKVVGRIHPARADAKAPAPAAEPTPGDITVMGQAVGTPAYMAPEQAAGRWDLVGPAADVYSLGATLYHLLTGRAPFRGSNRYEVLARVQCGALLPPRRCRRDVPAALDAVCRKATAAEPEQRYATAADLAQDVERWLADEPVEAYREPWTARLTRWARRHQTALGAAAAVLLSAVAALGLSTGLIWREQQRTAAQKEHAERGWARAEENFDVARGLAQNLLETAEKRLSAVPQTEIIRKDMTDTALVTFEGFLRQRPADRELQEWTARLYHYSANVHRGLNDVPGADPAYRKAIELLESLVAQNSENPFYRDRLAETLRDQSQLLEKVGKYSDAAEVLGRAVAIARRLQATFPNQVEYRRTLAIALLALSDIDSIRGQFADAVDHGQEAARLLQSVLTAAPHGAHPLDRLLVALPQLSVGVAQRELGRLSDALASHTQAVNQFQELLRQGSNRDSQHFLGRALSERGRTLLRLDERRTQAEADFTQAIEIWGELQNRFPQCPYYREYQAAAYEARAQVRVTGDHPGPAEEDLEKAQAILEKLAGAFPEIPAYRGRLGGTYAARGRLALARGDARRAADWLAKASQSLRGCLERAPEDAIGRRVLEAVQADLKQVQVPRAGESTRAESAPRR
jgi:serine/threonine-protein kinase